MSKTFRNLRTFSWGRFSWTENTVCIWDNRSVIHFAIADFYPGRGLGYQRVMDRIAIEGDVPV